ncbi:DUF305 domain-containing protein [Corynebacterium riegelii]|uniref:DUF305 domain-containing protein n=1 Tax=Corynebacterium riegelii TaxID=156976 RepID=UPI0023F1BAB5|nr:DUF305 domain-containing protein [Corynebacterium riegelii]
MAKNHSPRRPYTAVIAILAIALLVLAALFVAPRFRSDAGGDGTPNDVDVHFIGMMVPHHDQAIEMSDVLLASDVEDPAVRDLAQRIKEGQERENEQMLAWADEWGIEDDMELHSHHIANGMFIPSQLEAFRNHSGDELRAEFLEMMHHHHAEVIAMTQGEVDNGGYAPLKKMAKEMIAVQTAEMREMEQLQAAG